jgi:uncharacterized protein (TIGR02145 family)
MTENLNFITDDSWVYPGLKSEYGRLYTWDAALIACPTGWHLPSDDEWTILTNCLGGPDEAGGKLKETGTAHWPSPNSGTNSSGFSALPGGYRYCFGEYNVGTGGGDWWSSTPHPTYTTWRWNRSLNSWDNGIWRGFDNKLCACAVRCVRDKNSTTLSVTTKEISDTTSMSAQSGGNITNDGGAEITARGVCWNTTGNPTITDNKTLDGTDSGEFTSQLTGLESNTQYYVRAYSTTRQDTAYGDERIFKTLQQDNNIVSGTFTDSRDGHEYKWVKIGNQEWMAENLAYLPEASQPSDGSLTEPYYYVYDYNGTSVTEAKATDNYKTYGVLYNWPAALTTCPPDWHLPSNDEWKKLEMAIGMSQSEADDSGWRGTNEGTKLKATSGWYNNGNGSDEYGFSALPGGYRLFNGSFHLITNYGHWWSSTGDDTYYANCRFLRYNYANIYGYGYDKQCGYSVRCVRD